MIHTVVGRLEQQDVLLEEWQAVRAQINRLEARASALLAERAVLLDEDVAEQPVHREAIWRSMIAEYSAAGRIAKGSAEHAFTDARFLASGDHPILQASFEAGSITAAHVREILHAASPVREAVDNGTVAPGTLGLYETAAVVFAEAEAPARTRARVREVAAALAGSTITERHERARAERNVTVRSVGDGLALLQVVLPEHLAVAIHDRLTRMAHHQKRHPEDANPTLPVDEDALDAEAADPRHVDPEDDALADEANGGGGTIFGSGDTFTRDPFEDDLDAYWEHVDAMLAAGPQPIRIHSDERSMDQIRTDLLTDLLLTANPGEVHGTGLENITATIQVTISADTLTGTDDNPAGLDGHGELHPDIARRLAGTTTGWTRLFLDPTGMITETDTYTPTAGMRRFLRARDQHCRFPGCRMPVHRTELDHTHDHALGGPTAITNLAHLCRTHHALKHPDTPDEHRWTARQLPRGDIEWTTPAGRVHTDRPARRVMFIPTDELTQNETTRENAPGPKHRLWAPAGEPPPWAAT